MNKKVLGIILALALNIAVIGVAPTLAKNFNVPEGVGRVYYSGGEAIVDMPESFPYFSSMKINLLDIEAARSDIPDFSPENSKNRLFVDKS